MAGPRFLQGALWFACCALFLFTAGCQKGPRRAAVSGQVLVDRVPLAEGSISFFPTDGTEGPEAGEAIRDGKYVIPVDRGVIVGKNKVVIRGFRKSGRLVPDIWDKGKMIDENEKALGPEYNDETTLIREIQDGKNTFDFDLKGLPK